ncbi:MAG: DUF4268 domain-containing protein [Crocinitomicaceae bacterium]
MFTSDEKKDLTRRFWHELNDKLTISGKMNGRNIDWMNYPNKINHLYFRMESTIEYAKFCVDIQFLDAGVREVFFEQFEEFKMVLSKKMPHELVWLKSFEHSNGKTISRIYSEINNVSVYNEGDWPKTHQFLVDNFIAFDGFWQEFGEVFRNLK